MNIFSLRLGSKISHYVKKLLPGGDRFTFYPTGFHGDEYLIKIVSYLLSKSHFFVETGCNVGSTSAYVARNFPDITSYSCEPDEEAYELAVTNLKGLENARCERTVSPDFLYSLVKNFSAILEGDVVFWLDAHGYDFKWPLKEEVSFITKNFSKAYIFIDDFKVPGREDFVWDKSGVHECSYEYIAESFSPERIYRIYYPCYQQRTSKHHPLTGWVLIEYGHDEIFDGQYNDIVAKAS